MGGLRATRLFRDDTLRLVARRCVGQTLSFCGLIQFVGIPAVTGTDFEVRLSWLDLELIRNVWSSCHTSVS